MRTIGELVSERTGEKEKGGKKEREREEQCCITLNLPEYLPSEPCDDVYPLTNAHGTQASSLSSLSLSFSLLLFTPVFYPCSPLSLSLSLPLESRSRPFSPLPFLFLLRLLFEVNPPISYALHRYTGCRGNIRGYR